jgi:Flp pilus assembly pilin Flp
MTAKALWALWRRDEGQDLIEYALIGGLVALVAVAAITTSGQQVNRVWTNISTTLTGVNP